MLTAARPGGLPASLRLALVPADMKRAWQDELGIALGEVPEPQGSPWPPSRR